MSYSISLSGKDQDGYDVEYLDSNITYNYYDQYKKVTGSKLPDILHGKTAKETISMLEKIVNELGTEKDSDYWANTPGNAGAAVEKLLNAAKQYPGATWTVF